VLDVGCGYGASSLDLASVWGCARVTGIDITPSMLSSATREAQRAGLQDSAEEQKVRLT
jgi:ubiquinone/menaquinone biosynthesis C-methylase UbiE